LASPIDYFDKDDALHPYDTPDYYEWWYLDAIFPGGWIVAAALFWRTHTLKDHAPSVQLDIYSPDGRKARGLESFSVTQARAGTGKCDVTLGPNLLRQDGDQYHLVLKAGELGVNLIYTRKVNGWKPTPTGLMVDDATGRQGWCNPIPRGEVEGTVWFEGQPVSLTGGQGYHDHNWGDTSMDRSMGGWGWGRVHAPPYTFVYGWLTPLDRSQPVRPALFVARDAQPIFVSGDMACAMGGFQPHLESGLQVPTTLDIRGQVPWGVEVDFKLTLDKVLDWQKNGQATGSPMTYFRRLSRMDAAIRATGLAETVTGQAIDEYVLMGGGA
jgi:hypothetical protein